MYARDHAEIATPIGTVRIEGDETQLLSVRIAETGSASGGSAAMVRKACEQLEQWFAGERRVFDLALRPANNARGETLRAGLIAVGYGETLSYGALAQLLGSGPRAIGQLCARNPFPIIVPCHRILSSGGALGSYSASDGPRTKAWLLDHERRIAGHALL